MTLSVLLNCVPAYMGSRIVFRHERGSEKLNTDVRNYLNVTCVNYCIGPGTPLRLLLQSKDLSYLHVLGRHLKKTMYYTFINIIEDITTVSQRTTERTKYLDNELTVSLQDYHLMLEILKTYLVYFKYMVIYDGGNRVFVMVVTNLSIYYISVLIKRLLHFLWPVFYFIFHILLQ